MFRELIIDRSSGRPVSLQIADYVKSKISDGRFAPGSKFLTTQEFVKKVGVGPHTVRQAMKHLEEEGLVKSKPRLGTVICENAFQLITQRGQAVPDEKPQTCKVLKRIGVIGLVQKVDSAIRYCVETAEGITQESERLGIVVVVLPNMLINMKAAEIYEELRRIGCEGLIWAHNFLPDDPDAIDYICSRGIKVIFRRRSQKNDGRSCIDADYESAGYKTGQYFCGSGIKELLIFSHFDFNAVELVPNFYGYPTRIKSGIVRAYEHNYKPFDIEVCVNKTEEEQTSAAIYDKLRQTSVEKGIVFTNGYQLLNYLKYCGDEGREILAKFKTVAISNLTINYKLRPYVEGLEIMVLVDNFKEAGRLLVGNLMGMVNGYFDSATTTLVNVDFVKFEESFTDAR